MLLFSPLAYGGEKNILIPFGATASGDPDLKDAQWNRYATKNFTILSIDDNHGKYLFENIEKIKTWILTRWGLPDQDFAKECRILCVKDKSLFIRLFGINQSKVENRKDLVVVWLLCDDKPTKTIPGPLTKVCLFEYTAKSGINVPTGIEHGMAKLDGTIPDIRDDLKVYPSVLKADKPMFWTEALLTMTPDQYHKMDAAQQSLFNSESAALVLLLRKEFGQHRLLQFINNFQSGGTHKAVQGLGFKDVAAFDATFKRFLKDLAADLVSGRTPDFYLDVRPVKK